MPDAKKETKDKAKGVVYRFTLDGFILKGENSQGSLFTLKIVK